MDGHIHINYAGNSMRPESFDVTHTINGVERLDHIKN